MAKSASKNPYKKPSWVEAPDRSPVSKLSPKAKLAIAGAALIPILLFMAYQTLLAPEVKTPDEAATIVMGQKREDGKIFDQWVRERMSRLCKMGDKDGVSFSVEMVRNASPRGGDRYDVWVVPVMANANPPLGCPPRHSIAGVYTKDGTVLSVYKGTALEPKFAGPMPGGEFWLNQFLDGEKP